MEFEEKTEIERRFKKLENAMVEMEKALISKSKEYDELLKRFNSHINAESAHNI